MILLPAVQLPATAGATLDKWQAEVDGETDYASRVTAAKTKFKGRNTKQNVTFKRVKEALTQMCSGARRCAYCEDNVADEVEHIAPKDLYPEHVFRWANYVYACGPCNGPKNNRLSVFDASGVLREVTRKSSDPVVPPLVGDPGLINPRVDNPVLFFDLDLLGTFMLLSKNDLTERDMNRAECTIWLLDLNRDVLLVGRRTAFESYRARLYEYREKRDGGASSSTLSALADGLKLMSHPTVWAEMQRTHLDIPELKTLFDDIPEAFEW